MKCHGCSIGVELWANGFGVFTLFMSLMKRMAISNRCGHLPQLLERFRHAILILFAQLAIVLATWSESLMTAAIPAITRIFPRTPATVSLIIHRFKPFTRPLCFLGFLGFFFFFFFGGGGGGENAFLK